VTRIAALGLATEWRGQKVQHTDSYWLRMRVGGEQWNGELWIDEDVAVNEHLVIIFTIFFFLVIFSVFRQD
jgi:hypothetical protein